MKVHEGTSFVSSIPILVQFSNKYINSKNDRLPLGFQFCFRKSMGLDTEQSLPKAPFFI